jgi:Uma2 family endonuclease
MNIALGHPAEEFPPHRLFTAEDISRMIEAGVLTEDERIELIEGEIVVMAAKHAAHEYIKSTLNIAFARIVPDGLFVSIEGTLQLARDILVEPDIAIITRSVYQGEPRAFAQPRPQDILLLVEVVASSLTYDRRIKARLYARHGIREFWVIDANERITWVHTGPSGDGWSSIVERGPHETLTTPALPTFAIKLGEIG